MSHSALRQILHLSGELVLFESGHEGGGQSESSQAQSTLGASADIMYQSHSLLIEFFLVVKLVLDQAQVDEVAHVRAGVPSNTICIHVDLSQILDHLSLVCRVCL